MATKAELKAQAKQKRRQEVLDKYNDGRPYDREQVMRELKLSLMRMRTADIEAKWAAAKVKQLRLKARTNQLSASVQPRI